MPFTYISLFKNRSGLIEAVVSNNGNLSAGSENSQLTNGAFAVFRVDEFSGLEKIRTEDLMAEIRRRLTDEQIMERIACTIDSETLISTLRTRIK